MQKLSRRGFLAVSGTTAAGGLLAKLGLDLTPSAAHAEALKTRYATESTTICPYCGVGCGLIVSTMSRNVINVEGDPEIPFSEGRLCVRCLSLPTVVHHPDRLTHPLKRTGERGEGKWQKITWDEAYDLIEENVRHSA